MQEHADVLQVDEHGVGLPKAVQGKIQNMNFPFNSQIFYLFKNTKSGYHH